MSLRSFSFNHFFKFFDVALNLLESSIGAFDFSVLNVQIADGLAYKANLFLIHESSFKGFVVSLAGAPTSARLLLTKSPREKSKIKNPVDNSNFSQINVDNFLNPLPVGVLGQRAHRVNSNFKIKRGCNV